MSNFSVTLAGRLSVFCAFKCSFQGQQTRITRSRALKQYDVGHPHAGQTGGLRSNLAEGTGKPPAACDKAHTDGDRGRKQERIWRRHPLGIGSLEKEETAQHVEFEQGKGLLTTTHTVS